MKQSELFRGIYEFEDPSGAILAAKVPLSGSAALYDGTTIVVRPNQRAIFIYQGRIADVLKPGTHQIKTDNFPILTEMANWKFGFKSPLRCEIWFFSGNMHTSRKWGTKSPVMSEFDNLGTIPIRAFGSYNVAVHSPRSMYENLVGSQNVLDIMEIEDFVQGQIIENLPEALQVIREIKDLNHMQNKVSKILEKLVAKELHQYGLRVKDIQIQSLLPPKEVLDALEKRMAMNLIGDQQKYLMYQAANSLDAVNDGTSNDPMQMMMGLMMGKGMFGMEGSESNQSNPTQKPAKKKIQHKKKIDTKFCHHCGAEITPEHKFCHNCGGKV